VSGYENRLQYLLVFFYQENYVFKSVKDSIKTSIYKTNKLSLLFINMLFLDENQLKKFTIPLI